MKDHDHPRLISLLTETCLVYPYLAVELAALYIGGSEAVKNEKKAEELLEPLAKKGNLGAAYNLYHLYIYGGAAVQNPQKAHDFITALSQQFPHYTAEDFLVGITGFSSCVEEDKTIYHLNKLFIFGSDKKNFPWEHLSVESQQDEMVRHGFLIRDIDG